MDQPLSPSAWLAQWPLQPHEQLFAVLGNASDAQPFEAWQGVAAGAPPRSIWASTAYADWTQVMPYLAQVEPGSAFLDWVANTQAEDWGWLAVSSSPADVVLAHLQGLTQVKLPEGPSVFLRFWDGTQFLPLLRQLGGEAGQVLPVFQRYLINGKPQAVATGPVTTAKASPWWQVPASLLEHLAEQSPQTLIDNLLQWLEEQRPDLYIAFTPATLQHKVAYFARGSTVTYAALTDYLASEAS